MGTIVKNKVIYSGGMIMRNRINYATSCTTPNITRVQYVETDDSTITYNVTDDGLYLIAMCTNNQVSTYSITGVYSIIFNLQEQSTTVTSAVNFVFVQCTAGAVISITCHKDQGGHCDIFRLDSIDIDANTSDFYATASGDTVSVTPFDISWNGPTLIILMVGAAVSSGIEIPDVFNQFDARYDSGYERTGVVLCFDSIDSNYSATGYSWNTEVAFAIHCNITGWL